MSIRKLALLAAVAALGLLALGAVTASATTAVRLHNGTVVNGTIKNTSSGPATLHTDAGKITCTTTAFDADVNGNPAATVTGKLTTLTFTSCTDNLLAVNVLSCHLAAGTTP